MKRFISLILTLLLIVLLTSCTSKNNIKKLNYEGISDNWKVTEEFNTGGDGKIFIEYIGDSTVPEKINFQFEHLSGNTSGGCCVNSKKENSFSIIFANDDKLNDRIEKYGDRNFLNLTIEYNNKSEKIKLHKVE